MVVVGETSDGASTTSGDSTQEKDVQGEGLNWGKLERMASQAKIEEVIEALKNAHVDLSRYEVRIPGGGERIYETRHDGECGFYLELVKLGTKIPFNEFVVKLSQVIKMTPAQFNPNLCLAMNGFILRSQEIGEEPSLCIFADLFSVQGSKGFAYVKSNPKDVMFSRPTCASFRKKWKDEFFYMQDKMPDKWAVPTHWSKRAPCALPAFTKENALTKAELKIKARLLRWVDGPPSAFDYIQSQLASLNADLSKKSVDELTFGVAPMANALMLIKPVTERMKRPLLVELVSPRKRLHRPPDADLPLIEDNFDALAGPNDQETSGSPQRLVSPLTDEATNFVPLNQMTSNTGKQEAASTVPVSRLPVHEQRPGLGRGKSLQLPRFVLGRCNAIRDVGRKSTLECHVEHKDMEESRHIVKENIVVSNSRVKKIFPKPSFQGISANVRSLLTEATRVTHFVEAEINRIQDETTKLMDEALVEIETDFQDNHDLVVAAHVKELNQVRHEMTDHYVKLEAMREELANMHIKYKEMQQLAVDPSRFEQYAYNLLYSDEYKQMIESVYLQGAHGLLFDLEKEIEEPSSVYRDGATSALPFLIDFMRHKEYPTGLEDPSEMFATLTVNDSWIPELPAPGSQNQAI